MLIFNQTRICELTDEAFPSRIFNFKGFDEIHTMENIQDGAMFGKNLKYIQFIISSQILSNIFFIHADVIGIIGSCYKPEIKELNGSSTSWWTLF